MKGLVLIFILILNIVYLVKSVNASIIGNPVEGTFKWELYSNDGRFGDTPFYEKMGTVFNSTHNLTVDRIYAFIRNAPLWTDSVPVVRAFIYDYDTDSLLSESQQIVMPASGSSDTPYEWFMFLLKNPVNLTQGKRYLLGLHVGAYGGIDWKYTGAGVVVSYKTRNDNYTDGADPNFGIPIAEFSKNFSIFARYGEMQHGPVAEFVYNPKIPLIYQEVTFNGTISKPGWNGSTSSPIQTWEWDFGDGSPKQYGKVVTHTFTESKDYVVSLTVIDEEGLNDTEKQNVTVTSAGKVPIFINFENDGDFQLGIENAPRHIIYTRPTEIIEIAPKVWTYGGYSNVYLQEKLGGNYFSYLDFRPEYYNDITSYNVPPSPTKGTRCAKLELKNPNITLDDETRRFEIFRYHDPNVIEKEIEAWIYLPTDFEADSFTTLLRISRELMFRYKQINPNWTNDEMLNVLVAIGKDGLIPGTSPRRYRLSMPINHFTQVGWPNTKWESYRKYNVISTETITLGEWFHLQAYLYRHEKLGKIKVWLNDRIIFDLKGTLEDPIATMYIPSEILNNITPWNPGGGQPYGFVASGINIYTGDTNLHPKAMFVKDVVITNYFNQARILGRLRNLTSFIEANITVYNKGTNQVNISASTFNGNYILRVWPNVYDLQYDIFNIPNLFIKLISINIFSDVQDMVNFISLIDNKLFFTVNITGYQEIHVYSDKIPSKVLKNGTALQKVSSYSELTKNSWFYNSSENKLYMIIN